jgi:hypothetical protein
LIYELTQFIPLAIILLLTTVFYIWVHAEKRNQDVVVEVNLETISVVSVSGSGE